MKEGYGYSHMTDKERRQEDDRERSNREQDMRMKYGKKWKDFDADTKSASDRLRPGEVKRFDKKRNRWVSNKD